MSSAEASWTLAGWYIWKWQKVTSSLDWYFLACYPCEAMPSPCDIKWQNHIFSCFFPPSLSCLFKGTAWHFKSLLFLPQQALTALVVLSLRYPMNFSFFFFYLHWNHCKGAHIKLVILHLFIWTFSFHCSQCSLNVKLDFCQTEDSTLYLILLKHPVPEFHTEETWIPPTVKVWIGLCICMRYISSVNPLHFFKVILSNS